jgi:hypothetical protein
MKVVYSAASTPQLALITRLPTALLKEFASFEHPNWSLRFATDRSSTVGNPCCRVHLVGLHGGGPDNRIWTWEKDEIKAVESAIQEIGRKVEMYKTGELRKETHSARRPLFHIDSNINRFLAQHEGRVHFTACILQLITPTGLLRQFARFEHPRWDFSLGHCTV